MFSISGLNFIASKEVYSLFQKHIHVSFRHLMKKFVFTS